METGIVLSTLSLTFRVAAITVSGHNRFSDRHGGKFLNKADGSGLIAAKNGSMRGFAEVTLTSKGLVSTDLCWTDDNLDTGPSEVEVVILNGPGYTVHPERGRFRFTIRDNDDCANPAATPGGVVYKMDSGGRTCICATESRHSNMLRRLADQPTRQSAATHQAKLRQLGTMFHDPSHLYCPESPWKGLPE